MSRPVSGLHGLSRTAGLGLVARRVTVLPLGYTPGVGRARERPVTDVDATGTHGREGMED